MDIYIPPYKKMRIEINSDCNRKCVFCPRGTDTSRWVNGGQDGKKQQLISKTMSTENVLSLIDQNVQLGVNAEVGFDFYNEVTMDERLLDFCVYAKNKHLRVALVSNGDSMKKDELFTRELFTVSDFISISLYDYKDADGRTKLMNEWNQYLFSLGIPRQKYELVGEWFNFGTRGGLVDRKDKYMGGAEKDHLLPIKANCKKIHSKLNIRYDGEVPICCEDSHVRFTLGNVIETSIKEVWWGDRMKIATSLLADGNRAAIPPCSMCTKSIVRV